MSSTSDQNLAVLGEMRRLRRTTSAISCDTKLAFTQRMA
jgi:hypothetical protein